MQNSTPDKRASKHILSSQSTAFNELGTMSSFWLWLGGGTLASQVLCWPKEMRKGLNTFHFMLLAG